MFKVLTCFQNILLPVTLKLLSWFMKWATFDTCPVLFNGANNGHCSLRWLMDLAIYAAKEIVYLSPLTSSIHIGLRLEGKNVLYQFCLNLSGRLFS